MLNVKKLIELTLEGAYIDETKEMVEMFYNVGKNLLEGIDNVDEAISHLKEILKKDDDICDVCAPLQGKIVLEEGGLCGHISQIETTENIKKFFKQNAIGLFDYQNFCESLDTRSVNHIVWSIHGIVAFALNKTLESLKSKK